nr:zinc finger, CCHC-type [Tanacetum cinerariifolium]
TTGIIFYYGESPISWSTQKQATVALSSCKSEFIAATAAATSKHIDTKYHFIRECVERDDIQADDGTFMEEPAGVVASIGKKVVSVGSLEWVRRYTLAWVNIEELQRVIEGTASFKWMPRVPKKVVKVRKIVTIYLHVSL